MFHPLQIFHNHNWNLLKNDMQYLMVLLELIYLFELIYNIFYYIQLFTIIVYFFLDLPPALGSGLRRAE